MSTRCFLCFVHRWYFLQKAVSLLRAAKDTLRTGPSISDEMVPSTKPWMALPSGCIAGSRKARKMLWGLPPIHFGKEDGVERTLLRVACQSEPFLASPWQGGASIRFLWHIGCQSDFDELVSMASRPVDRGFGWMGSVLMSFHPVKGVFCRMGRSQQKTPFGRALPFLTKWFPPS